MSFGVGSEQFVNCLRIVYAEFGLTFNLKQRGPAEGAGIEWVGLDGFVHGLDVSGRLVELFGGDPSRQVTNAAGQVSIGVEGHGQPEQLPDELAPVSKSFSVKVLVQLKTAEFWGDVVDALKVTGTPLDAIRIPLELLQRTRWVGSQPFRFALTDWVAGYSFNPMTFQVAYTPGGPVDDVFTVSGYVCGDPATAPWTLKSHVDHLYDHSVEEATLEATSGQHFFDEDPSNYATLEYLDEGPPQVRFTLQWNSNGISVIGEVTQSRVLEPLTAC